MIAAGWSPSVRLFEAAACGIPIISDRWRGLDALLPDGEAIAIADDTATVVALLADEAPEDAQRRAARARAIILAGHTGTQRARGLLSLLSGRGASDTGARPEPADTPPLLSP
jgi:spore maturation protein CgeB